VRRVKCRAISSQAGWKLSQVPKKIFFYWGAKRLSFLRYMSLYSFRYFNPDWEIFLYVPKNCNYTVGWKDKQYENIFECVDYLAFCSNIGVNVKEFDFETIGISNSINEVHKSDFIRYFLLYTYGGVWSDIDILFNKPIENIDVNKNKKYLYDSYIYFCDGLKNKMSIPGHAIGLLMSSQGSDYFKNVFNVCKYIYKKQVNSKCILDKDIKIGNFNIQKSVNQFNKNNFGDDYQVLGAYLLNSVFNKKILTSEFSNKIGFLSEKTVYPISHNLYKFLFIDNGLSLIDDTKTIGLHWYGGSPYVANLLKEVNHLNYLNYNNNGTLMGLLKRNFNKGISI